MKIFIFMLITLLGILLITLGDKKNNTASKIMGYSLLLPILFAVGIFVCSMFIG